MQRAILPLVLFLAFTDSAAAQCLHMFGSGTVIFSEVCNPSGADSYGVVIDSLSVNSLSIGGLWAEPTVSTVATVNCANLSFSFGPTPLITNMFYMMGTGSLNGSNCSITYTVYSSTDSTAVDNCTGTYPVTAVSVASPRGLALAVYPVPSQGRVTLATDAEAFVAVVRDVQGRELLRANGAGGRLDLHLGAFAAGLYQVEVVDVRNARSGVVRVLKE